jgi:exodeoxyribonuclease VII small subunit
MSKSTKGAGKSPKKAAGKAAKPAAPTEPGLSFEGALEQLETTVGRLEEGEMPLEEALELFEKGVSLSKQCTTTLEAAEKRIEILVADRGGRDEWASEPFETDAEDDDSRDGSRDDDDDLGD